MRTLRVRVATIAACVVDIDYSPEAEYTKSPAIAVPLFLAMRNAATLFRRIIEDSHQRSRPDHTLCAERPSNCGACARRRNSVDCFELARPLPKYLWRPCSYNISQYFY